MSTGWITPFVGRISPHNTFISVDLPEPVRPMMAATISPSNADTDTPWSISISPHRLPGVQYDDPVAQRHHHVHVPPALTL